MTGTVASTTPGTVPRGGRRWAWGAVALITFLAVLDTMAAAPFTTYIGLLVVGPFVAAAFVGPGPTSAIAVYAVFVAALLLAASGAPPGSALHTSRLASITLACGLAVWVSTRRVRRERAMIQLEAVAEAAQRAIIRRVPPVLGRVGLTARYLSASEASTIGGDLYETADTPFGVRVLIGDARGKGLEAVQLAAVVLGSFREAAFVHAELAEVALAMASSVRRHADDEDFVTAVLVEFERQTLRVVNCGHPAPLHLPAERPPRLLGTEPTTPLGLDPDPRAYQFEWNVGDRVLLYTDGLIEARDASGRFLTIESVADACAGRGGSREEGLDEVVRRVRAHVGGRLHDDLALLLAELHPEPAHAAPLVSPGAAKEA